jgi:hypothetical protein
MPRLSVRLPDGVADRLQEIQLSRSDSQTDTVIWLINQEHARQMGANWAPNGRQMGAKRAPNGCQKSPNPSRRRASSPSGKNKNNNITNSLSKNPTLKAGKNSDKDAGEPKAEKETPPRLNHKFFVGLLDGFGEEHPEYLTDAVKAAWSEFVTHRQSLGANKTFGTKTGALGVLRMMHKLSSKKEDPAARAVELLQLATCKRWFTIYEPKEEESAADDDPDASYREFLRRNMQG